MVVLLRGLFAVAAIQNVNTINIWYPAATNVISNMYLIMKCKYVICLGYDMDYNGLVDDSWLFEWLSDV